MSEYVGRLAPSPTGLLHLGHARTFWIASERARAANGKLWLRDDDLDPQRSRPEFATAMREDLRWLGITWNEETRQSERLAAYRQAMQQLIASDLVYVCHCSRRDLQQAARAPHEETEDEPMYRGTCRPTLAATKSRSTSTERLSFEGDVQPQHLSSRPERSAAERPPHFASEPEICLQANYRFRVPDDELIRFNDANAGAQSFRAGCDSTADFGDFLVWRKDGLPSYQLACVVDDAAMRIVLAAGNPLE